jgi:uncharacterized membrane protein
MELDVGIRWTGTLIDGVGVVVIALGILIATGRLARQLASRCPAEEIYNRYRQTVGRAILLGLELLVAGDIIRTVAIRPTFTSVGVLVVIVLVRTFLSWTLEVELNGRFPWQHRER